MSANYGVNVTISAEAARPISVQSNTPIGLVGTSDTLDVGLHFFMSIDDALSKCGNGTIKKDLKAIDEQAVKTQIILSVYEDDEINTITNAKAAISLFKQAKAKFDYRPNLLIAPEISGEDAVKTELESVATALKATAIIDLNAESSVDAIAKMRDFGSKRLIAAYPFVKTWDDELNSYEYTPQSARIAGMIAKTDGESEFGYSNSYSNRIMLGIAGTKGDIYYEMGENCEADELRNAHISTIIREQGFRTWGGETSDADSIWQDLARVRIFDRISEACQKGVFFAIDRKADELYFAKQSVEELLRGLKGAKVLLGYELSWSAKNTKATITAGKFYLDVRMQNNPIVKQLTLDFIYTDKFGDELMGMLSA